MARLSLLSDKSKGVSPLPGLIGIWVNIRRLDLLPQVLLPLPIRPKSSIPVSDVLLKIELPFSREARHQLRFAQRQLIASVCLPQMVDLAIQVNDLLHLLRFCSLPHLLQPRRCGTGHDQHS